ncbi:tRNA:m(4)X modification enzyme TRM13 homolog-like Protein [Tribolium castaneum]|uniref:tRNA:m(4)X modification enzyme TRM13 n=1 Tax=Tribolium castaneum TaxID=7070 RepID=D7EIE5_TRICA|nr:PREDICTED: tRNA:m(4)X modification enzyme TRM13 homolog [Tribolium castaneum]XP_968859.1 PREDICTED: tRNA:m(4)X modification enzyme TRM13 homolog [Tribolium castaneum]EFA11905.1 tRNA:m(4)X modification enzyme TRM13 homolog-like Protein [Tribolium castaneum]|eukprot:XP_015840285.1 PREDICTED: tRNA:m(4)X modification enzyme TRM13 homolog [Tribolium castaneum]
MSEEPPHCNHFVIRKKRFCRMTVKPGDTFCGEHQPAGATTDDKIRIVCPLDPKHTCYAHNLRKHLKICNARPGAPVPYLQPGVNSGGAPEDHKLLSEFAPSDIVAVIGKINTIFEDCLRGKITSKLGGHKVVEAEMAKPEYGDKSKKHLKQASAILGLLDESGLIKPETCFVEFGAGRGLLSYWLAQACPQATFLLIERSSPKHKRDNKLEKSDKVRRIRADIADLVLDKLDAVSGNPIVGVTKHLCGDATDLALRCLANVSSVKVGGLTMTFCCHHRCRWPSYVGKDFFNRFGLTKNDFEMMCGMSSWATCGTGFSREKNQTGGTVEGNDRDKEIGVTRSQKEELGRRSKAILNWGRLQFLEGLGFECRLHYYVEADVSLENVCIVAKK